MIATIAVNTDSNLVTICALSGKTVSTLQTRLYYEEAVSRYVIPAHICRMLDVLFGQKAILCWRNAQEMQLFIDAAKHYLNFRIKHHSIILPQLVDAAAQAEIPITPEMLNEATRIARKTPAKNVSSRLS